MYVYDEYDHAIIEDRVKQFRDQTNRYFDGKLSEDEFLPLRLQNGLYVQRMAPMLRVAVPYGMLSSKQLRKIAEIARKFDKGYVHISTRQNIQFNWPELSDVPDILAELATVEMHAVQTSGNCIRNTTTDQFAGVCQNETEDPRAYCEIIRQWSTIHPEFAFLPRKFKIAVNANTESDRSATDVHDISLHLIKNEAGETGFRVVVGGGLGRTPIIGSTIREYLPTKDMLTYIEAIVRVYNQQGNRLNKYKARIKILVKALKPETFAELVEAEWAHIKDSENTLTAELITQMKSYFTEPDYETLNNECAEFDAKIAESKGFANWIQQNIAEHKKPGYTIVTLAIKRAGHAPGDITDIQLDKVAELADLYSFGEARSTHEQNIVLADVKKSDLYAVWKAAQSAGFASPNLGLLTDMICCPGGDYCALANAKSIPVADEIMRRFDNLDYLHDLGELDLNISGCMNACGHHHVGNIGILGVDKKGEEFYQISLGGDSGKLSNTSVGKILGPSFKRDNVVNIIEKILNIYIEHRQQDEIFIDTFNRIGMSIFKERVYATAN